MTTRADPPLPLSRLRARGELLEVRAADLRFTAEEAEAFLNQVMGLRLEPALVAALEARTEGWAAGLQLAALSARGRTPAPATAAEASRRSSRRSPAATGSSWTTWSRRSWTRQPDDVRAFLLDTSVLDQLTGAAVRRADRPRRRAADAGDPRARATCSSSRSTTSGGGTATTTCSPTRCAPGSWPSTPTGSRALHRAASAGTPSTARWPTPSAMRSPRGDLEHAADLVELALPSLRQRRAGPHPARLAARAARRRASVAAPLLATPHGVGPAVRGRPRRGRSPGSTPPRRRSTRRRRRPGRTPGGRWPRRPGPATTELRALPAMIAVYRAVGRPGPRRRRRHRRARPPRPRPGRAGRPPRPRCRRRGFLGLAAWAAGDLARGGGHVQRGGRAACTRPGRSPTSSAPPSCWPTCGWRAADPTRRGGSTSGRSRRPRRHPGPVLSTTGDLHVGLADVLREQGDLDAAAEHLQTARELGDGRRCWRTGTAGTPPWPGCCRRAATSTAPSRCSTRPSRCTCPASSPTCGPIPAARARVRIAQGRLDDARAWAREHRVGADDPPTYLAEYDQLTLARLLVAQHRSTRASALDTARGRHALLDRIVAPPRPPTAAAASSRPCWSAPSRTTPTATRTRRWPTSGRALADGVPAGYCRLFLDEGPADGGAAPSGRPRARPARLATSAAELLRAAARRPDAPPAPAARAAEAGAAERARARGAPAARDRPDRPGDRRQLFMSVNTFRTHTRHIFTKLDVNTRRAAVAAPRDLGPALTAPRVGITNPVTSSCDVGSPTSAPSVLDIAGHPSGQPEPRSPS